MATLTIRNLPDDVRDRLRIEAAKNGRSMEAEARAVLEAAVKGRKRRSAAERDAIVARVQEAFAPFRSADVSIVDELIAERRLEAWNETVEALEDLKRSGKPDFEAAVRPPRARHGA
jgi:plasmid stability protein